MSAVKRVKSSKRPNFADEFKRALVEQTFEPDASVSLIARCNDINTCVFQAKANADSRASRT
ncbi:transposase, partial [Burkholderia ubonensis]|uniref:transposase n=1 Tax=Burkholderia ubonensis TaxID=101571 RepID=UPI001161354E